MENIKKEFVGLNNSMKLSLKCQFYEAKMNEKGQLLKYVDRITNITDRLDDIGCYTEEKEICFKILSSIPENYRPITLSCLMIPEDKLSVRFIKQQFALERTGKTNKKEKEITALSVTTKSCYKCGIKDHIAKECRAPQWKIEIPKEESRRRNKPL